jgi:hypothetical protein
LGSLPSSHFAILGRLLEKAGSGSQWEVGFWDGYGWVPFSDLNSATRLFLDQRTYFVRACSGAAQVEATYIAPNGIAASEPPTLIWPSDRSWFAASDPDLDSTLVGGDQDLIQAILGDPGLEAWAVVATDDISINSDRINGPPRSAHP